MSSPTFQAGKTFCPNCFVYMLCTSQLMEKNSQKNNNNNNKQTKTKTNITRQKKKKKTYTYTSQTHTIALHSFTIRTCKPMVFEPLCYFLSWTSETAWKVCWSFGSQGLDSRPMQNCIYGPPVRILLLKEENTILHFSLQNLLKIPKTNEFLHKWQTYQMHQSQSSLHLDRHAQ